jgi:hypothetical protein
MPAEVFQSTRTPTLNDPDVRSLVRRYPPTYRDSEFDSSKRHRAIKQIIEDSKDHLLTQSSKMIIQENDLKVLLERYRGD